MATRIVANTLFLASLLRDEIPDGADFDRKPQVRVRARRNRLQVLGVQSEGLYSAVRSETSELLDGVVPAANRSPVNRRLLKASLGENLRCEYPPDPPPFI